MADRLEELKAKRTPLEDAIWRMRYEFPPKPIDVDLVCNAAERLVAEVERLRALLDGTKVAERAGRAEVERLRAACNAAYECMRGLGPDAPTEGPVWEAFLLCRAAIAS